MALRWDLLKFNKQELPQITPLQMAENGGIDIEKSLALAMAQPKSLQEKLGGRTVSIDTETLNPETNEMEINRVSKYQPGLLEDIRNGAKENFATGFAAPNLEQTTTPDGRNKGFGYRLGEGLGSFARFANSPLGRGLLMAGIVGATGGTALPAMAFGAQAGFGNKQVRLKDQLYRNALAERKIDTSDIGGFIDDNTFKYLLEDQQLRDNAEYRKMYYDMQDQNQKDLMEYRRMQALREANQDAFNNYIKSEELKLAKGKIQKGMQKFRTAIGDKDGALQQIQEMKKLVQANPDATGYIVGKFAKGQEAAQKFANEFISSNPEAIKTRAAIAKLRGTTMHDLAGTAQTLQEQRNLAPFLPDATDNAKTILAKLEQLEKELLREKQTLVNTGYELGFDYDEPEYQPQVQTTQISSYKEGQTATNPNTGKRMIFRGGKWQTL